MTDTKRTSTDQPQAAAPDLAQQIAELCGDWSWRTDARHRFSWCDARAPAACGLDDGEILGHCMWELPGAVQADVEWNRVRATMDAGAPFRDLVGKQLDHARTLRWQAYSGVPLFGPGGEFIGYQGIARDITEQGRLAARLARLNQLYSALSSVNEAVARAVDEGAFLAAACVALHALAGFPLVSVRMLDSHGSALVPVAAAGLDLALLSRHVLPDTESKLRENWEPSLVAFVDERPCYVPEYGADPRQLDSWERAREQHVKSILAVPLRREGRTCGALTVGSPEAHFFDVELIDLIERVAQAMSMALTSIRIDASRAAAAQRLRDSEERFKQLAALAADWYWESDVDDRVTLLPESYRDLTGVDPATRIGQPAWPGDGGGFAPGAYETFRRALAGRQPFYAVEYRRADFRGDSYPPLWLSISGEPVFDPDGDFAGYRGTTANITARRAAEERAMRSSRLYAALGEVSEMVAAGGDQTTILESACSALHDVARFDQVSIRIVDESGAELVPVAVRGWEFETLSRYRLTPIPEGAVEVRYAPLSELSACAYLEGRTRHSADYQRDPALQQSWAQARLQEIGSLLAVPLRRGATTVGVLTVGSRQRNHFDADYIALVERVANAVSLALEARDALNRLAANEERFRRLNDIAADWIWESDAALRLNYLSPAYYELTQARPQDVLGVALGEMIPALDNESARPEFLAAVVARQPFRDFEYVRRDADGSMRWRSLSGEPVVDVERGFMGYRGTGRDISQRKRHEAELVRQANHDALTGLPNRALLSDRLEHAILSSKRAERSVAVLLLDLDQFKLINDSYGHPVGDAVLRVLGTRLVRCVRGNDTIARLGGDEFVALLEDVEAIEISEVARRILGAIEEPLEIDGYELQLSTSIGIAVHPRDGDSGATLMRNADAAMYEAKASGRNAFRFYTQELNQRASRHLALRSALNRALERNEFELHYQPIVSCEDGRIVGAEALIRWRHADGHLAMPGEFLDVAEETGLIVPIGSWVLRAACAQAQQWWASGHAPVPVSVNVSAHQFRHGELVEVVRDALAESRLGAGLLTLEITESTVMTDLDRTAQTLASIASLGVVTAIDDFGTGHSSLSYLKRFPVRVLKIDRSFVTDAPKDADDAAIVRAVIDLAHALGMRVVAEGVETDEHVALLLSLGCDSMQGYRFGRPAPAADFEALLRIGTIV